MSLARAHAGAKIPVRDSIFDEMKDKGGRKVNIRSLREKRAEVSAS